ncbi:MAG: pantoate--beta-alanine ligase [Gammaproteobacteria bacterium]|nr:pantoate--beta-alanine ligase [Gammaproteobacteria bacterium]
MIIFETLSELRAWRKELAQQGKTLAFVPTMGNLHEGHLTLVKEAHKRADVVITSIFVNPMQFGENEDLDAYPRTFEADCEKLKQNNNHAVFYPNVKDMYPNGLHAQTFVEVPDTEYSLIAESSQRPGHFRGVSTVVTKLFNMVQPDVAVFGEKDFQQLRIIRLMVEDLNMPIEIIGVPTVREESGLAKSSRNGYLTAEEKAVAPALNMALEQIKAALISGNNDIKLLTELGTQLIDEAGLKTDYIEIRHVKTLSPVDASTKDIVILGAAYLGKARLIDNLCFERQ